MNITIQIVIHTILLLFLIIILTIYHLQMMQKNVRVFHLTRIVLVW